MPKLRRPALALFVIAAGMVLTGCASVVPNAGGLPVGSELLATSGTAMRAVTSAHLTVDVQGALPGVSIKHAAADLDAHGTAQGTARIVESGGPVKVDFVLLKHNFYVKRPTGGYQKAAPGTSGDLLDLTAALNPNHGLARLVMDVNGATTQDTETVDGVECYRVTGTADRHDLAAVVPGLRSDAAATVWVATSDFHLLVRAEYAVAGLHGGRGAKVDVAISNVNAPVSVTAPGVAG